MVYTVTFNPSLDYVVTVPDFRLGETNRTASEELYPGGKGINVSIMLEHLGVGSTAIYFSAGFVGEEITRRLGGIGIRTEEISVYTGCSRINLKLKNMDGTEINGKGPEITPELLDELRRRLSILGPEDYLVLAGSIPGGLSSSLYREIMEGLRTDGRRSPKVLVDATGEALLQAVEKRPFLIKPNHHELGELFDVKISSREEAVPYAKKLQDMGAMNVLVSLGGEGAVLVAADGSVYSHGAPGGALVNSVGAGDSMLAGFLTGWIEKEDYSYAFTLGLSAGSASAFSPHIATKEDVKKVFVSFMTEHDL